MNDNTYKRQYWMSMDAKDLAQKLETYHGKYFSSSYNPIWQTWQKNAYKYYSNVLDSQSWWSGLNYRGEQGELVEMQIPQARSLIRQLVTLITKQKLAFNAIASTRDDHSVVEAMRIANALAIQIVKEQKLDVVAEQMVEKGLVIGTAFLKTTWRTDKGDPFAAADEGQLLYSGDLEMMSPDITDMLYDFTQADWRQQLWAECRVRRNRWDLIDQNPQLESEIMALPSIRDQQTVRDYFGFDEHDDVWCYELYHKKTPSLKGGRMLFYSNFKTIYHDGENEYEDIPIEQFRPEQIFSMGFGYPMFSALLPAQEMYDHEASCVATNHSAFGVQNIAAPRQAELQVQELLGMNLHKYTPVPGIPGGGKPEALQLTQDSPNAFKFTDFLLNAMQQISNLNSAIRGEIGGEASGVAIATLTTNALEFLNSYTKSYQSVLRGSMTHAIKGYARFCKVDRLVSLTGKNNQTITKYFNGQDLSAIDSMELQEINPLMHTLYGRLDIAEKMVASGLIATPQKYFAILDGQPLSSLIAKDLSQSDLIDQENQSMLEGQPVITLATDDHAGHIQGHSTLLNDTDVRRNSPVVQAVLKHIEEHNQLQKMTDPFLQAMVNTGKPPQGGPIPGAVANPEQGAGMQPGPAGPSIAPPENEPAQPAPDMLGRQ